MTQRRKAIVVIDNMLTGGIATSLYNFLHFTQQWLDVDLLAFDPSSIDKTRLPKNVKILTPPACLAVLGLNQSDIRKKSLVLSVFRAGLVLCSRLISGQFARDLLFLLCGKRSGYDMAISYAQDNGWKSLSKGCNDFVARKIKANYKVAYIHCDYKNYGGYDRRQEKILKQFDAIACVSAACTESFASMFPALQDRCITCENFTNVSDVKAKSEPAVAYSNQTVNFVTVCRLSTVKGLDRTIEVFAELDRKGYTHFQWTIVGDGPEKHRLHAMVKQNGLEEKVIFAGEQNNPYPYIKNATAFLLPSVHEAAPMVFGESAALGVPILTTSTCSAVELVQNRNFGLVVENSKDGIKKGLKSILDNPVLLKTIQIREEQINKMAYQQVEQLIGLVKINMSKEG